MNCSDFLKELTDYLDGAIDDRTKAELDEHLAWCHNCFVICNTTKMTIEIYRDRSCSNCLTTCAPVSGAPSSTSASIPEEPLGALPERAQLPGR